MLDIELGDDIYNGALTGYRILGKFNPRSPIIGSKVMLDFAIAEKMGKVSISLSSLRSQEVTYSGGMYDIEHYFTGRKVNMRSNRYAITGNLMRALEYAETGKVVTYKTNRGRLKQVCSFPKIGNQ